MNQQKNETAAATNQGWFERVLDTTSKKIGALAALIMALATLVGAIKLLSGSSIEFVDQIDDFRQAKEVAAVESVCERRPEFCAATKDFADWLSENNETEGEENDS